MHRHHSAALAATCLILLGLAATAGGNDLPELFVEDFESGAANWEPTQRKPGRYWQTGAIPNGFQDWKTRS